jgi:hypothetical protein
VGINFVIVNGQIEVDNGERTPALAGEFCEDRDIRK